MAILTKEFLSDQDITEVQELFKGLKLTSNSLLEAGQLSSQEITEYLANFSRISERAMELIFVGDANAKELFKEVNDVLIEFREKIINPAPAVEMSTTSPSAESQPVAEPAPPFPPAEAELDSSEEEASDGKPGSDEGSEPPKTPEEAQPPDEESEKSGDQELFEQITDVFRDSLTSKELKTLIVQLEQSSLADDQKNEAREVLASELLNFLEKSRGERGYLKNKKFLDIFFRKHDISPEPYYQIFESSEGSESKEDDQNNNLRPEKNYSYLNVDYLRFDNEKNRSKIAIEVPNKDLMDIFLAITEYLPDEQTPQNYDRRDESQETQIIDLLNNIAAIKLPKAERQKSLSVPELRLFVILLSKLDGFVADYFAQTSTSLPNAETSFFEQSFLIPAKNTITSIKDKLQSLLDVLMNTEYEQAKDQARKIMKDQGLAGYVEFMVFHLIETGTSRDKNRAAKEVLIDEVERLANLIESEELREQFKTDIWADYEAIDNGLYHISLEDASKGTLHRIYGLVVEDNVLRAMSAAGFRYANDMLTTSAGINVESRQWNNDTYFSPNLLVKGALMSAGANLGKMQKNNVASRYYNQNKNDRKNHVTPRPIRKIELLSDKARSYKVSSSIEIAGQVQEPLDPKTSQYRDVSVLSQADTYTESFTADYPKEVTVDGQQVSFENLNDQQKAAIAQQIKTSTVQEIFEVAVNLSEVYDYTGEQLLVKSDSLIGKYLNPNSDQDLVPLDLKKLMDAYPHEVREYYKKSASWLFMYKSRGHANSRWHYPKNLTAYKIGSFDTSTSNIESLVGAELYGKARHVPSKLSMVPVCIPSEKSELIIHDPAGLDKEEKKSLLPFVKALDMLLCIDKPQWANIRWMEEFQIHVDGLYTFPPIDYITNTLKRTINVEDYNNTKKAFTEILEYGTKPLPSNLFEEIAGRKKINQENFVAALNKINTNFSIIMSVFGPYYGKNLSDAERFEKGEFPGSNEIALAAFQKFIANVLLALDGAIPPDDVVSVERDGTIKVKNYAKYLKLKAQFNYNPELGEQYVRELNKVTGLIDEICGLSSSSEAMGLKKCYRGDIKKLLQKDFYNRLTLEQETRTATAKFWRHCRENNITEFFIEDPLFIGEKPLLDDRGQEVKKPASSDAFDDSLPSFKPNQPSIEPEIIKQKVIVDPEKNINFNRQYTSDPKKFMNTYSYYFGYRPEKK